MDLQARIENSYAVSNFACNTAQLWQGWDGRFANPGNCTSQVHTFPCALRASDFSRTNLSSLSVQVQLCCTRKILWTMVVLKKSPELTFWSYYTASVVITLGSCQTSSLPDGCNDTIQGAKRMFPGFSMPSLLTNIFKLQQIYCHQAFRVGNKIAYICNETFTEE